MSSVVGGTAKLNTGYDIPLLGLGTYKITGAEVKPTVDRALAFGFRLFDTAKYYVNEPELGAALEELLPKHKLTRGDIFITTKFHMNADDPAGGARKLVMESLERLRTSYVDMVMIHYPKAQRCNDKDENNKLHRKLSYLELEKLKNEGKIRSVGVSNYEIRHIEEIKEYSKMVPCANQVEIHPHFTREELRQYCKKEGIFMQVC
ncbi:glyoxal reductase family protein [Ostertagia ostertagi]